MHRFASALIAVTVLAAPSGSQAPRPDPLLPLAEKAFAEYMVHSGGCAVTTEAFRGWPAGALRRCSYSVADHYRDGSNRTKAGLVYLANLPPERLLAWLETACAKAAAAEAPATCVRTLAAEIRSASGAQFPVAGLVWEDQLCGDPRGRCRYVADERGRPQPIGDGVFEPYVFRGGVTVRVNDVENGVANRPGTENVLVPTPAELEAYVTSPVLGMSPRKAFARVASTTRTSFARLTRRTDIPVGRGDAPAALAWSGIVEETFRHALASGDNPLLDAQSCEDHRWPASCR